MDQSTAERSTSVPSESGTFKSAKRLCPSTVNAFVPVDHAPELISVTPPSLAMTLTLSSAIISESAIDARVVLSMVFSASVTATPTEIAASLLAATDILAETSFEVIDELSTANTVTDPPASTNDRFSSSRLLSTIKASTEFVVTFLAYAPAPANDSPVLLLAATLRLTAAAMASISLSARAETVTSLSAPVATTSELSMAARLLPEMVFSASDTDKAREPETLPLEAETLMAAATTLEVIVAVSMMLRPMLPAASTELLFAIRAWVEPPILFVAEATPTAPERLTVPLLADTLTATATVFALIELSALASIKTAPAATTSELLMPARTALVIVFEVTETAPEREMVTVPEPAATEAERTASVASMVLVLSASMVSAPPAMTDCNSALSASTITASTTPPMVLVACVTPTAPDRPTVPPPALTEIKALMPIASMSLSDVAVMSSAPPEIILESRIWA